MTHQKITPIILSGGAGKRLWPLSSATHPKQFLHLDPQSDNTLFQETALRFNNEAYFAAPIVLCHEQHLSLVENQLHAIDIVPQSILLEPEARNTAPATTVGSLAALSKSPGAIVLLLPSDHIIRDVVAFHEAIQTGLSAAQQGYFVTLGITPTHASTQYGYIQKGAALSNDVFNVAKFAEKPDENLANLYLEEGNYLWNAGIFLFQARTFINTLKELNPAMFSTCEAALNNAQQTRNTIFLKKNNFARCENISIDYAVMECCDNIVTVPVEMGWSDIGSWEALQAARIEHNNAKGTVA